MDEVDLAILREFMRSRTVLFGTERPRLSLEAVARRLDLDPSTVRARVRRWEKSGFLTGIAVFPNPRLFGAAHHATAVHVPDLAAKAAVLDAIADLDGVLHCLDHLGGWIGLGMAAEHPQAAERRLRSLARLDGVAEVQPLFEVALPAPTRTPTPLDWRVLHAWHEAPRDSLAALAKRVGVSVNTFHARSQALVEGNAVLSVVGLDFGRFQGGGVVRTLVSADAKLPTKAVTDALGERFHPPLALQDPEGLAVDGVRVLDLLLYVEAVAEAEDVEAAARAIPGVRDVEVLFPRRHRVFVAWTRERLGAMLAASAAEGADSGPSR